MTFIAGGNFTIDDVITVDGSLTAGQCGGTAVYAALGMWVWGESPLILAGIGTDYPMPWLEDLTSAGMDLSGTWSTEQPHALRSRVFYRSDGSRTDRASEYSAAPEYADRLDLSTDHTAFGSDLHTQIWPLYCPSVNRLPAGVEIGGMHVAPGPSRTVEALIGALSDRRPRPVATLDWPWWNDVGGLLTGALTRCSALLAGAEELRTFGPPDQECLIRDLAAICPTLVVKEGSQGCVVYTNGRAERLGVVPVEVDDPTGAGDAFCGGFCVGLARTGDPVLAAAFGSVSASYVVETRGALGTLAVDRRGARSRLDQVVNTRMEIVPT